MFMANWFYLSILGGPCLNFVLFVIRKFVPGIFYYENYFMNTDK